jgi:hypothetical protein
LSLAPLAAHPIPDDIDLSPGGRGFGDDLSTASR